MVISHPLAALASQAIQRVPRAQEGFLNQIFGQHLIVAQPAAETAEVSGIGPDQHFETPLPAPRRDRLDGTRCIEPVSFVIHD